MKLLYIFPHPDDESFGPARAISRHVRQGYEVHLLTLTRGGATKQRQKYGYSIQEMGEVRYAEMLEVQKVLDLAGMTVLDMPDSGLKEMDPREIEWDIIKEIEIVKPQIVITYPVHGISGFHDHLVTHAVVKRVFTDMKAEGADYLRRLAFITLNIDSVKKNTGRFRLHASPPELIDCIETVNEDDIERMRDALKCYVTYQDVIKESGVLKSAGNKIYYEFFQEFFAPAVADIAFSLP